MTNNEITKKNGFKLTEAPLSNWPEDKTIKYLEAPEVEEVAKQLIDRFREDLKHINIAYVFKKKLNKDGDSSIENDMRKVLHQYDVVITIGFSNWVTATDDHKFRTVLHELEKIVKDEEADKIIKISPSVAEFPKVMQVFGPSTDAEVAYINAWEKFKKENSSKLTDF
jgi:hypothetical protein